MATLEELLGNMRLSANPGLGVSNPAGSSFTAEPSWRIGQTIQGSGNWDANPLIQQLQGMQGQSWGSWATDENGRRYMDTPFGRQYDQLADYLGRGQGMVPGEGGMPGGVMLGTQHGILPLGQYANEHGSDAMYAVLGPDGTLQRIGTDRNSNRDMNTMLALIASAGVGSALYGGAAAGGAGGGSVSAAEIAAAAGSPELGLVATPGTAAAATAGGIPASALAGGPGALTLSQIAAGTNTAGGGSTLSSLLSGAGDALTSPAGLNTLAQLLGGAYGAHQANRAAEIQAAAARDAIAEQRRQYDTSRADMMPWMEAGRGALGELQGRMPELTSRFTGADLAKDPGYQFELDRGREAIDAAARATGISASGATLKELLGFSQGLASTKFNEAFNRHQASNSSIYNMLAGLSGTGQVTAGQVAGLGQNAAGAIGDLMGQGANARAAGRIGGANSWINALGNAWNGWQQQNTLNRLLGSNLVGG